MNELENSVEKMLLSGATIGEVFKKMGSKGYSKEEIREAIKESEKKHIKCSSTIFD